MYSFDIKPFCKKSINKAAKKNPILRKAIENKISEILENPLRFKSLRYDLSGEYRVHILKNYVLKFRINFESRSVLFIFFGHHDSAY